MERFSILAKAREIMTDYIDDPWYVHQAKIELALGEAVEYGIRVAAEAHSLSRLSEEDPRVEAARKYLSPLDGEGEHNP